MKFIHLSDLHIGKSVNGFSMLDEQKKAFEQIISYIKSESPDAVIIAGDIYDRAIPSVEAVRLFDDFLTELSFSDITLMLISGNHDSPERIAYASRILSLNGLCFYCNYDGTLHKVTLCDEYGKVNFWLLPFIKPSIVRSVFPERQIESFHEAVACALETCQIDCGERNVLISHQFYCTTGVFPVLSDSELNPVGGLEAVDTVLLKSFDYTAAGHLHGAQSIGNEFIRYCGSPLKYSFSECRQLKSITFVHMKDKGEVSMRFLPIKPIHDMREIKGRLDSLLTGNNPGDREDYLRVILTDENEIIDPLGKLRCVYPNIMSLGFDNSRTNTDLDSKFKSIDAGRIEGLSLIDMFCEFFLDTQGSTMSEEQSILVRELLERQEEQ